MTHITGSSLDDSTPLSVLSLMKLEFTSRHPRYWKVRPKARNET
jgi:hypothetical protein